MKLSLLAVLVSAPLWVGCKDDATGNEPFDTYQLCFDDHTEVEMLMVKEAIVVCCLEHPIGGVMPVCKATVSECINFLTANLKQTSANTVEVMEACADYIDQLEMM